MINKIHKISIVIGYGTLISIAAMVIVVTYWLTKDYDVLVLKSEPVAVSATTSKVKPGGEVVVVIDYCKNYNAPEIVYRRWIVNEASKVEIPGFDSDKGENTAPRPTVEVNTATGCYVTEQHIPIIETKAEGTYHIEYEIQFKVNPLRTIKETFTSTEFEIAI